MRSDLAVIMGLIAPESRVLDLGCGDGELLAKLRVQKQVTGYGIETDPEAITKCIERGINVIEHDIDLGLARFPDDSFDLVVMTDTLQALLNPASVLDEMLRIGRECLVTFPNFGHWRCRWALLTRGRMPVARHLPHSWHSTPNIHLCTVQDFDQLCEKSGIPVLEKFVVNHVHRRGVLSGLLPNLFGGFAFYRLGRPTAS